MKGWVERIFMLGINGFRSPPGFFFAFIDSLLILIGILLAISPRFIGSNYSGFSSNLWVLRNNAYDSLLFK